MSEIFLEAGKDYIAKVDTVLCGNYSFVQLSKGNIIAVELSLDDDYMLTIDYGLGYIDINCDYTTGDFEEIN